MAMARDGSIQLGFGMGKYTNRNVIDAYGAVSRVRVSGRFARAVRSRRTPRARASRHSGTRCSSRSGSCGSPLDANDVQPVAFEWTFEAALPTAFEDRTVHQDGFRTSADLVRYHQIGVGSGWVEVEGERTELTTADCVSTRDHSWGVRYGVGVPPPDVPEVGRARRSRLPDGLVPAAVRARRRLPVRDAHALPDRHRAGPRRRAQDRHGRHRAPGRPPRAVARPRAGAAPTTRRTGDCAVA